VLHKFVLKPYLAYLDTESERREKLENDYKNIETLHKNAQSQADEALNEARKKAHEIEKNAETLARKKSQSILEHAQGDAKNIKASALGEIEKERLSMEQSMRDKVLDLALKLNGKLFDKEAVNKDFFEKELSQVK